MRILIDGIAVECSIGDIAAQQDIGAIVIPAGPGLVPGPGVSGAVHGKAGSELYQECIALAPIMTGKVIITSGYHLPNTHVIHCRPPSRKDEQSVRQLEQCYMNALLLADEHQLKSVAFPSLVPGSLGTPPISGAAMALKAIRNASNLLQNVRLIRFVLFDRQVLIQYRNLLAANPESILQQKYIG